jgi:hypothetical protein
MTDGNRWQAENAVYLSAAVAWVRLLLERQARHQANPLREIGEPLFATDQNDDLSRFARWLGRKSSAKPATVGEPTKLLPPASDRSIDEQISRAADAVRRASEVDPPPALLILAERFGLSQFERDILLLCAAIELDTGIASLCNLAQGRTDYPYPSFALAMAVFEEPAWEALSPERPLRNWRLIEINQPGAQPLTTSALRIDERILNYLKGLNYLDDRLAPLLVSVMPSPNERRLAPSQQAAVATIIRYLAQTKERQRPPVIQLPGSDSASKQLIAWRAASELDLHLSRLPVEWLPSNAAEMETLARLLNRESALIPVAFYIDASDKPAADSPDGNRSPALNRFLSRVNCLVFLDTRDIRQLPLSETVTLDVGKPTRAEQQAAWAEMLGDSADDSSALLAGQFNLGLPEIDRIVRAIGEAVPDPNSNDTRTRHQRLWDECLATTRPRLDELAQRLDAKATWHDIVLPSQEARLLEQISAQVSQRAKVYEEWGFSQRMNRGLGISALFAGDSGTGKTMAAEVIANDLRLNLYRIDLSAVVSKYIGETEKNLRRLFDAAEDGGAILFFDEADALFGKRSEVKDSHDRYANIEINYLLQRLEAYRGLAILATNMKDALDPAFVRRLRFIVKFSFPGVAERREIWRRVFPPQTAIEGIDFDRLVRLNLTGGNIHNVALNAAFLAARAGKPVTMPFIFEAARSEFGKLERPVNEADLFWQEPETDAESDLAQTKGAA